MARLSTAEPWEVRTNLARHHARINAMKPTVKAGQKKRRAAGGGGGGRRKGHQQSGRRPAEQRLSLPAVPGVHKRATPQKAGRARHVKTSPAAIVHLPELEHRMLDAVESSSDAIAILKRSMGVAVQPEPTRGGRPPRHRRTSGHAQGSARSSHSHDGRPSPRGGRGGGGAADPNLREAYEVLLERTEVLADELEELREQERQQKVGGIAAAPTSGRSESGVDLSELERLRALIVGLEQGVQTSSAQLASLRGRFDEEVEAKASEVEGQVRRAEQARVAELERALKASSSTNEAMESALADMQKKPAEKKRIQSEYGQADVAEDEYSQEFEDAAMDRPAAAGAGDVTVGEVNQMRLAWTKAFERRSGVALVKLFAGSGRLAGSLWTVAKGDAPPTAPFAGADALTEYFQGLFQRYPHVKVQGAGMLRAVDPSALQPIAEATAVWSTSAELHLYEHPQDVVFKAASVSFVFTLGRPEGKLEILSQNCIVTSLVQRGVNDKPLLSARGSGGGKNSARGDAAVAAEEEAMTAQQHLAQRAEKQAAQKKRREEIAAKKHALALETEAARREQEEADRKSAAAKRKRELKKRQVKASADATNTPPKSGMYAVKGSKKMEQRLAGVHVKTLTSQSAATKQPAAKPPRPSPEKISPRKTPRSSGSKPAAALTPRSSEKKKTPRSARGGGAAAEAIKRESDASVRKAKAKATAAAQEEREMNSAASKVQARQRGRKARREVGKQKDEMNGAASMLQARQRGRVARRQVGQQKTEMNGAASKLQARARGRLARKELAQRQAQKMAEAAVAAAQRASAAAAKAIADAQADDDDDDYGADDYGDDFSDDFEDETESAAATEPPEPYAASSGGDWAAAEEREQAAAAVKMQALQRGRKTRRQVASRKAQARAERQEMDGAARRIQARHRGRRSRQRNQARAAPAPQDEDEDDADDYGDDDYDDDFSDDFEEVEAEPDAPDADEDVGDDVELQAAARRIQARQRGKRARKEQRERHQVATKIQAMHRGRRTRQEMKQRKAAEAVAAAREASLLAAALDKAAQDAQEDATDAAADAAAGDDDYSDDGFSDDFDDDGSLDAEELWAEMETATAPAPAAASVTPKSTGPDSSQPFQAEALDGELTELPALASVAPTTADEFISPTPSMREDVPSLAVTPAQASAFPSLAPPPAAAAPAPEVGGFLSLGAPAPAAAVTSPGGDDYGDDGDGFDSDFDEGSLDMEDMWDKPVMKAKADPPVPA